MQAAVSLGKESPLLRAATVLASGHHANCRSPLLLTPPGVAVEASALILRGLQCEGSFGPSRTYSGEEREPSVKSPTPPLSHMVKDEAQSCLPQRELLRLRHSLLSLPRTACKKGLMLEGETKPRLPGPHLGHCRQSARRKVVALPQKGLRTWLP